jgi:UDP-glucose 4-epimerase
VNILVTGGAGYIGSITAQKLCDQGHQVSVVDDLSKGHRQFVPSAAKFHHGKVHDIATVSEIIKQEKIDSVIHFAAHLDVAESMSEPLKYYENNFNGTISLLEAIEKNKSQVKHFIFSSTAAVYKDPGKSTVTENSPTDPLSPYGRSKLLSEQVIAECALSLGYQFVHLRYFNVAGASLDLSRGQLGQTGTALFKRAALAATDHLEALEIYGQDYPTMDGTGVRDYIHVEDLTDLHIEALKYLQKGGASEVFNCGYGKGFSVRQVISSLEKASGKKLKVIEKPRRPGDLAQVVASNQKVVKAFQWTPKHHDLDKIAESAYQWELKSLV